MYMYICTYMYVYIYIYIYLYSKNMLCTNTKRIHQALIASAISTAPHHGPSVPSSVDKHVAGGSRVDNGSSRILAVFMGFPMEYHDLLYIYIHTYMHAVHYTFRTNPTRNSNSQLARRSIHWP